MAAEAPAAADKAVASAAPPAAIAAPAPAAAPVAQAAASDFVANDAYVHASPAVRRLAREFGVNLAKVKASGRKGRIVKEDVQAYVKDAVKRAESAPAAGTGTGNGMSVVAWPKVDFSKFGPVEELELTRERVALVLESEDRRLSERMNKTMYRFGIITCIFLPMSFLTGLLGINVGGIPGSENPYGFLYASLLVLVLALGQWWLFRRLRWV